MYQCFHCGSYAVCWDSDFDFEDFGYEGQGIVHVCHCGHCGAEIEYRIPIPDRNKEDCIGYDERYCDIRDCGECEAYYTEEE